MAIIGLFREELVQLDPCPGRIVSNQCRNGLIDRERRRAYCLTKIAATPISNDPTRSQMTYRRRVPAIAVAGDELIN